MCFPYLVEIHMLTIGSTTSVFHCTSSLRSVVLCCAAFHSLFLRSFPVRCIFFPFHFFTFRFFLCPLFHSSTVLTFPFFTPLHSSIPVHISVLCLQLLFLFPVVSIPFFSSSFRSFPLQSNSTRFTLFRSIPFHPIPLHSIRFLSSTLHSTPSHSTELHCCPFRFIPFQAIPYHSAPLALFHYFLSFSFFVVCPLLFLFLLPFLVVLFHACSFLYISVQSIPLHSNPCVH